MGQRFPAVTARQLLRVLHGRRTVVPIHPGVTVKRKTLAAILDDAGLSIEEFRRSL